MNKTGLVNGVAEKSGLTKKDAEKAVNAFLDVVTETLGAKEAINLTGFGKFETRERAERKGHNPSTGEELIIPATTVPAFKAGKQLKQAVK
ncbi:HU family DNA-binding protein [Priestia megaterium]|uniref:HU family DNA-binding protein n=1 Tax=Priestia megaterium TaxID=1404 RepID=UPI00287757EB|nr:HU family DNA-binding protein [Priestia megaterium]